MRRISIALLLLAACTTTFAQQEAEGQCKQRSVESLHQESNFLAGLSLLNLFAGGNHYSSLAAHAENAAQQAEIVELQNQLCKQQKQNQSNKEKQQ